MLDLEGIYRFYVDNQLVHEEKNALTTVGRAIALKSLLGIIPNFGNAICYGIGDKPSTLDAATKLITDNSLQFEVGRTAVSGSSLDLNNKTSVLVYSGIIDDPVDYSIYEVGLLPSISSDVFVGARSSTIFIFNEVNNFVQFGTASGSFLSSNPFSRIGTDMIFVPQMNGTDGYLQYPATSDELDYLDLFSEQDIFRLAGAKLGETSSSVIFRLHSDDSNYFELVFNTPSASGYFIAEKLKYDVGIVGVPTWSNINYVKFWNTGDPQGVYLDGMRINTGSYLLDTNTGLISRAVLTEPIRKPSSMPLVIEYSLNVGFNEGF